MICQIAAHTFTTQYQYAGTTAKLRIYYSKTFIGSLQEQVVEAPVGSDGWYDEVDCTVSGGLLSHPSFNLVVTVNGTPPTGRVFVVLYSEDGVRRETIYGDARGWFVPATATLTSQAWRIANRAVAIFEPLREYLNAPDVTALILSLIASTAPGAHASTHQNGGADELNVSGLGGVLADPQIPITETVQDIVAALIANTATVTWTYDDAGALLSATVIAVPGHKTSHENGGSDELSVAGLSGLLADAQTPLAHKASHENGGADEISVAGLSGTLADPQTPAAHAASHISGGSDPFTSAQLIEAIIKRIQTSTGPTNLTVGAIADGEFLKRSGTDIVSAVPAGTGYSIVEDEGVPLTSRSTLNFTGAGVSVADSGGKTVATIGGGGSTDVLEVQVFS